MSPCTLTPKNFAIRKLSLVLTFYENKNLTDRTYYKIEANVTEEEGSINHTALMSFCKLFIQTPFIEQLLCARTRDTVVTRGSFVH